jgi:hypothetical protein
VEGLLQYLPLIIIYFLASTLFGGKKKNSAEQQKQKAEPQPMFDRVRGPGPRGKGRKALSRAILTGFGAGGRRNNRAWERRSGSRNSPAATVARNANVSLSSKSGNSSQDPAYFRVWNGWRSWPEPAKSKIRGKGKGRGRINLLAAGRQVSRRPGNQQPRGGAPGAPGRDKGANRWRGGRPVIWLPQPTLMLPCRNRQP